MSTTTRSRRATTAAAGKGGRRAGAAAKRAQDDAVTPPDTAVESTGAAAPAAVVLAERHGIADVAALHQRLCEAGSPLRIDAGAVETIDTSTLQLLVVHARELEASGGRPEWLAVSDTFVSAAEQLDLARHLHLPQ